MILHLKTSTALALTTLLGLPASDQSPELRTDDLPGMSIHRSADQMHRADAVELALAPMTGVQGWYLANEQNVPDTVRMTLSGHYTLTPGRIKLRPRRE